MYSMIIKMKAIEQNVHVVLFMYNSYFNFENLVLMKGTKKPNQLQVTMLLRPYAADVC